MQPKITYLGYVIDANGLHPSEDKVTWPSRMPPNLLVCLELRSFLGMINYYGKFLQNLSTKLNPLYSLLAKQVKWTWGPKQRGSFSRQQRMHSRRTHCSYTSTLSKPLVLACDASNYGIGAVLSHVMENGKERPIAFTSRTLNAAEKEVCSD